MSTVLLKCTSPTVRASFRSSQQGACPDIQRFNAMKLSFASPPSAFLLMGPSLDPRSPSHRSPIESVIMSVFLMYCTILSAYILGKALSAPSLFVQLCAYR